MMDKYLFDENGFVYELDDKEIYNPIDYIAPHNLSPYAKVKFEHMKEHQLEYVLQLLSEEKLFGFLESYEQEQRKMETTLYEKSNTKDSMTRPMIREWIMYQDLT